MRDKKQKLTAVSPQFQEIDNIPLLTAAKALPLQGALKFDEKTSYCYLKIDDNFIFKLFPMIEAIATEKICLPAYFEPNKSAGAHISLVYPNEAKAQEMCQDLKMQKLPLIASFEITGLASIVLCHKTFYALTVASIDLTNIRKKYGLLEKLNYRGFLVPFHITLAVC